MCRDCGCEEAGQEKRISLRQAIFQHGNNFRSHSNALPRLQTRTVSLEESVLAKNDRIAVENRNWFQTHGLRVLNLISSPGSGKTLLLEKTVQRLGASARISILNGDQEHDFDAQRLKRAGAEVLQINTANSCHLDAAQIQRQLGPFVRPEPGLLLIENVGNLVCPAAFDLGETEKVALLSCTEGEDKPAKYPLLFLSASLILITKTDLIPFLDWNLDLCLEYIRKVNPQARVICLSARTGDGMQAWLEFLNPKTTEKSA